MVIIEASVVFHFLLRISFGAPTEDVVYEYLHILQVPGYVFAGVQSHYGLQDSHICMQLVDPWVVSHAYGQSEPQQWLQRNLVIVAVHRDVVKSVSQKTYASSCECVRFSNWGILVWEILSVM